MSAQLRLYTGDDDVATPPCKSPKSREPKHRRAHPNSANPLTDAQRKAIFRIMHARKMHIDDLRAMTPRNSISALTIAEAAELLTRLNKGTRYERDKPPRKPRRPAGTISLVSNDQRSLIARFRIALGWSHDELQNYLSARYYPSDKQRPMDSMISATDAQAVIEHLKKILHRTLVFHGRKIGRTNMPDPDRADAGLIRQMMQSLPPHPRLDELLDRLLKAAERISGQTFKLEEHQHADGRLYSSVATCKDAADTLFALEEHLHKLATDGGFKPITDQQRSAALAANS